MRWGSRLVAGSLVLGLTGLTAGCAGNAGGADGADAPPVLGLLRAVPDEDHSALVGELRARGWTPGTDVRLLPADPEATVADEEEARATIRRWVHADVELVVAFSTPLATLLADEAPHTPGLFLVNDPVAAGLVADPDHPDGSLTGVTFRTPADRTLDLASRAVGGANHVGYLWPTGDSGVPGHRAAVEEAADELGFELSEASFDDEDGVADAVAQLAAAGVDLVFLASSTATVQARDAIEAELDRHRLPSVANTDFVTFAVVVLTPDGSEVRRQLARQAARLLAGAPVSAVPVEDPRKFTVIVNRSRIQELGLPDVADEVLRQADVVR